MVFLFNFAVEKLCVGVEVFSTNKENAYHPGNGFSRALESRFLVLENEAQCSYFHLIGPFS